MPNRKTKSVTLTVQITAIVDADAPTDELCLFLPYEGVSIEDTSGKEWGTVEDYETVNVEENS